MFDNARGGDDRLFGGDGDDFLTGDADSCRAATCGGAGDDRLWGGAGNDLASWGRRLAFQWPGGADRLFGEERG
jgi:Ca2+-binding RTX toxin-like protein